MDYHSSSAEKHLVKSRSFGFAIVSIKVHSRTIPSFYRRRSIHLSSILAVFLSYKSILSKIKRVPYSRILPYTSSISHLPFHYGRRNAIKKLKEAIESENENGSGVYYIKKVEARSLYARAGVQFPRSAVQDGLIHSIFDAGAKVNRKFMEQTETRQFKRWFEGSVIKNEDGTPKVMYHGTPYGGYTPQPFTSLIPIEERMSAKFT